MNSVSIQVSEYLKKFSPLTLKDLVKMVGEEPDLILEALSLLAESCNLSTENIEKEAGCGSGNCSDCSSNPGETHYRWVS